LKRVYPEKPVVGVGAVIILEGKILLEKRKNAPGKGKWSIPGGLVELGESTEQAVVREVKEETGLEVEEPCLIDVVNNLSLDEKGKTKYHYVIVDYLVKVRRGVLKAASDADELKLIRFSEVEKYDLTESFRDFFRRNRLKLENS
jgi:8-oxo-dGTP diphosphatase